jgi:inner membrane protein
MLAPTHSVFGIFLTLIILAIFGIRFSLHWTVILFAVIGAILPDIDHQRSVIGKLFRFISSPLEHKFGHRTITHSFIGWGIASIAFAFIVLIGNWILGFVWSLGFGHWSLTPRWISAFSIGYLSHLILDMFNKRGVQLLWPDPTRDVIPRNPNVRTESGSKAEPFIFVILLFFMVLSFPLSKYGLVSSLRWLLATPGAAIEEFRNLQIHSYLEFSGHFQDSKKAVEGTAEILDVDRSRLVILFGGNVYTLSDELSSDIMANKVRVKYGKEPIVADRIAFKDKGYDYLLQLIPPGALVSGTVHLPKDIEIKYPASTGMFNIFEQKGNDLVIRFADKNQVRKLALSEYYDIQRQKDVTELSKLEVEVSKIQLQIKEREEAGGLTPLGREMLMGKAEQEKQKLELEELNNKLADTNLKIEELKIKIKERKLLFSGEVYIRR